MGFHLIQPVNIVVKYRHAYIVLRFTLEAIRLKQCVPA